MLRAAGHALSRELEVVAGAVLPGLAASEARVDAREDLVAKLGVVVRDPGDRLAEAPQVVAREGRRDRGLEERQEKRHPLGVEVTRDHLREHVRRVAVEVASEGLAPREHGARVVEKPKAEPKPRQEARQEAKQKSKLSFKDKHALESLPAEMEKLRAMREKAQAILGDADLFAREPKKFEQASAALAKIDADLAAAEDRWLELEMLREELEG